MTDKSKRNTSTGDSTEKTQDHISALKLWRAVVSLAILDASSEKRHYRVPVARWLLSTDFDTVCDMANLNPNTIKRIISAILSENPIRAQYMSKHLVEEIEAL